MKRSLMAAAVAVASLSMTGCVTGDGSNPITAAVSTPQAQAATLGTTYALAKSGFAIYASMPTCGVGVSAPCKDAAVVALVAKALTISDPAVARAQADILAAQNQTALQTAVQAGFDALALFQQALVTYGVTPAATAPAPAPAAPPSG